MKTTHLGAMGLAALLVGCGGMFEGMECMMVCTRSSELSTSEIFPQYEAVRTGNRTVLNAWHERKSEELFSKDVQLDGDELVAETSGAPQIRFRGDGLGVHWTATHEPASANRLYTILLLRADGTRLSSSARVPPAFKLLSPASPLTLSRTSPVVPITVSAPPSEELSAKLRGQCGDEMIVRTYPFPAPTASGSGSVYVLDPAVVYAEIELFVAPTADLTQCDVALTLDRVLPGTVDAAFAPGGHFTGRYRQSLTLRLE